VRCGYSAMVVQQPFKLGRRPSLNSLTSDFIPTFSKPAEYVGTG
jgi:hypothetical protein